MLAQQVLNTSIKLHILVELIAAAHINLLVSLSQVAIRQQHGCAKIRVRKECAAVSAAHQRPA